MNLDNTAQPLIEVPPMSFVDFGKDAENKSDGPIEGATEALPELTYDDEFFRKLVQ